MTKETEKLQAHIVMLKSELAFAKNMGINEGFHNCRQEYEQYLSIDTIQNCIASFCEMNELPFFIERKNEKIYLTSGKIKRVVFDGTESNYSGILSRLVSGLLLFANDIKES
jgi:hypothetical protein